MVKLTKVKVSSPGEEDSYEYINLASICSLWESEDEEGKTYTIQWGAEPYTTVDKDYFDKNVIQKGLLSLGSKK